MTEGILANSTTIVPLLTTLLLSPFAVLHAQSSRADAAGAGYAVASRLEEFLGEPLFVPMQEFWEKRGGWGGVLTAKDGTVVAFQSPGGGNCRRSRDDGKTWDADIEIAPDARGGRALVAETKGDILYNSREHMSRGNRFLAHSDDGGDLWIGAYRSPNLPDGARGTSYGLMGGMIRLPLPGRDILLYSNVDTDAGVMPKQVGASIATGREKATVWASFDGGGTWPVKRWGYDGPTAYSNFGVGRTGTPSQGKIYLLFEGGPKGCHEAVHVVSFNLSWLLNGQDVSRFLKTPRKSQP